MAPLPDPVRHIVEVTWAGAEYKAAPRNDNNKEEFPVQIHTSARASDFMRETLQELAATIAVLQREHDQLIPLVVEGPPHLRPLRLRQLKSIAKRLVAARLEEATISGLAAGRKAA